MTVYPKNTGRMLDRTADGRAVSFAVDSPQRYRDNWRQTDRIMRYYGRCSCCGARPSRGGFFAFQVDDLSSLYGPPAFL